MEPQGIYELMMQLPLFNGVSYSKISEILEFAHLDFRRYAPGDVIVGAGEPCDKVTFIIKGKVRSTVVSRDTRINVSQTLSAPDVISPDFLFGRHTLHPATVKAIDNVATASLDKHEYMRVLTTDQVFLFNFLNRLSKNAQKGVEGLLSLSGGSIEQRLALWIVMLTEASGTDIELRCRPRELYAMFGVPRALFIAALESMAQKGIIFFKPGLIKVLDRRLLAEMLEKLSVN